MKSAVDILQSVLDENSSLHNLERRIPALGVYASFVSNKDKASLAAASKDFTHIPKESVSGVLIDSLKNFTYFLEVLKKEPEELES